jgi:TPR repeat protein
MGIARLMRIGPLLLVGLALQPAHAEDYETVLRNADVIDQKIHQAAVVAGNPAAQYALGVMCEERAQAPEAFRWYELAADHGHAEAMDRIGDLYAYGRGMQQDYVAALGWYRRAAAAGSLAAVTNLGTLYLFGFGVPQNYGTAARLLELAARRGDAAAENKLGMMYESGLGLARNLARARSWYLRSAQQGFTPAMVNLGLLYVEGLGVPRDDVQGYALVAAAVAMGIPADLTTLASQEIGQASERLDETGRRQAQSLARRLVARVGAEAIL